MQYHPFCARQMNSIDTFSNDYKIMNYSCCQLILCYIRVQFGAASSVGIDVDPQAITAATQNAALNKISPNKMQLTLVPPDGRTHEVVEGQSPNSMGVTTESESFDIVIANILLNPLLDLADDIVSHAKPGAVVAVSGIISEQVFLWQWYYL